MRNRIIHQTYLGLAEHNVAVLLCERGLKMNQIALSLNYSLPYVKELVANLKVYYHVKTIAQLGYIWAKENTQQEYA